MHTNHVEASRATHRCSACGATDIAASGDWLVCSYCRHRWIPQRANAPWKQSDGIGTLTGTTIHDGAAAGSADGLVAVECGGCGASVGMNTHAQLSASCPWCRHVLTLNRPLGNTAVPDAILPFSFNREAAFDRMRAYVAARGTHADPEFASDFSADTIHPVYLPYLIVDGIVAVRLDGQGWVRTGSNYAKKPTAHHVNVHTLMREVTMEVDDLAIEARSARSRLYSAVSTTNILNAVLPFDTKEAVAFDARYIGNGMAFEPRDTDVDAALSIAADHFATMARGHVTPTLADYTGGVRWEAEQVEVRGTRWVSMLLPLWIYAFEQSTPQGPLMHYVAVNGRTGEVEGSVPLDTGRAKRAAWRHGLALAIPGIAAGFAGILLAQHGVEDWPNVLVAGSFAALISALVVGVRRYQRTKAAHRNAEARYLPEHEASYTLTALRRADEMTGRAESRSGPTIGGANHLTPHVRAGYYRATQYAATQAPTGHEAP